MPSPHEFLPTGWDYRWDWTEKVGDHFEKESFHSLVRRLEQERREYSIFPAEENVFTAFSLTSYSQVKIVILGQDPYHGLNQAHGLSFSVPRGEKTPPSLKNIFKELRADLDVPMPEHGNLESWARQGVLLLNTCLTVREGEANSHRNLGWVEFTNHTIRKLNERDEPVVFVLWGRQAIEKKQLIEGHQHIVLESSHPSPLSAHRGFFGSGVFSKINRSLQERNLAQSGGKFSARTRFVSAVIQADSNIGRSHSSRYYLKPANDVTPRSGRLGQEYQDKFHDENKGYRIWNRS